jgi:hypothetical protein
MRAPSARRASPSAVLAAETDHGRRAPGIEVFKGFSTKDSVGSSGRIGTGTRDRGSDAEVSTDGEICEVMAVAHEIALLEMVMVLPSVECRRHSQGFLARQTKGHFLPPAPNSKK